MALLFSLDGRIGRKSYWIGLFVSLAIAAVPALAIGSVMLGMFDLGMGIAFFVMGNMSWLGMLIAFFVIQAALLYPCAAMLVKRLHDRDKSGWFAAALLVPSALSMVLRLAGMGDNPDEPSIFLTALSIAILVISVWFLIELGFLRGTAGPNRFGPDPLAQIDTRRRATTAA